MFKTYKLSTIDATCKPRTLTLAANNRAEAESKLPEGHTVERCICVTTARQIKDKCYREGEERKERGEKVFAPTMSDRQIEQYYEEENA